MSEVIQVADGLALGAAGLLPVVAIGDGAGGLDLLQRGPLPFVEGLHPDQCGRQRFEAF